MSNEEIEAYNEAVNDSIDMVQHAREEGETDMRQVLHWLRGLIKTETENK